MLKSLLNIQLHAVFFTMFSAKKDQKARTPKSIGKKILIGLFTAYIVCCMFFFFGVMMMQLCDPLIDSGLDTVYFVLAGLIAFMLMFIGSVFLAEKQLYDANDNELLLSMPIPPLYIVITRMVSILLINIMYGTFVMLPAGIVYFMQKGFNPLTLILLIVSSLLLSILSLSLSAVGGWLLALLSSNLRRKKLFSTVFMLTFFFAVMWFYSNLQNILAKLVAEGAALSDALRKVFPPLFFFGKSIAESDLLSTLLLAVTSLVPAALITLLISRSFINIATKKKGSASKYVYKEKRLAAASPRKALFIKEAKKFFSSVNYLMNTGLGSIFMMTFAVALIIKGTPMLSSFIQAVTNNVEIGLPLPFDILLPVMVGAVVGLCATVNDTVCCSLSLEGKNFSLLKSMPLSYYDIIIPKIAFNLAWGFVPVLIIAFICFFRLRFSLFDCLLITIIGIVLQFFTAVWGMLCNIFFPKFDWVNEITVIKQSAATLLALLGAMGFLGLFFVSFIFFAKTFGGEGLSLEFIARTALPYAISFFTVISAICVILLATVGKKKFNSISA